MKDTKRRQGRINPHANTLAGMIINHTRRSERAPVYHLIRRKVPRQHLIRTLWNRQLVQLRPLRAGQA